MNRREFARVGRDLAGLIALGALGSCRNGPEPRLKSHPFPHGVASGDPDADGVVL